MSELFDDDADQPQSQRPSRRGRILVIVGIALLVCFFGISAFASFYTERLWFREVGYTGVFSTMLWTRVGLFLVFGVVLGASVAVNMWLAFRNRPLFRLPGDGSVDRYRDAVTPIKGWLLAGVSGVVAIFAGTSATAQWRHYLLWRNAEPFGREDAYFGHDIGFYVFHLPWWHFVVDYLMAVVIVTLLATAVVHYLYGGIRLNVQHDRLSSAAQVQISVLLGAFVLVKAVDYYLDRYDLVNDDHSLMTGMNYTGENALLPARNILVGVALICAVLFFLNVWRRTWQLPSVGLALLALSSILLGMIWPAIVQNVQVKPSEADKEAAYLKVNIDATRDAYGLGEVTTSQFSRVDGKAASTQLLPQLSQVPVVDPKQVRDTFEQLQQPRGYYSTASVLDVDRYEIDGKEAPLVLGVREVDQSGIPAGDQNWSNLHTVYTHGEGIIAAYANKVVSDQGSGSSNGRMVWAEGLDSVATAEGADAKAEAETRHALGDFEERIYFGENSPSYSVVGKAEGGQDVELGLATTESGEVERRATYDGKGGVPVGSAFNQLMYAIKFGDANFLLSGRVGASSKVIYDRDPTQRVEKVAPWLNVDSDPYPAVVDGRIQWILDGYTTTDKFPNSQRESFEAMVDDSLQADTGTQGLATIPTDEINYMRSAVKATVDAYDGTVRLYQWDEEDPILKTWMNAFPGTVAAKSEIPAPLMEHLRYPEDLFKVQRYQLARYHVTDPGVFYGGNDRWDVPQDPNMTTSKQPPYRLFTGMGANEAWSLTSVFVPHDKNNLASFVSVNSDATSPDFGKINVLQMADSDVNGPGIVANEMNQDSAVGDKLQKFRVQGSAPPVFGNLLTVPVQGDLVYIQPVYAIRTVGSSSFRILQFVIVSYKGNVGIGTDLPEAIREALGEAVTPDEPTTPEEPPGKGGGKPTGTLQQQISAALAEADRAFRAADAAQAKNDTAEWAKQIDKAQKAVERAVTLSNQRAKR